jgi:hypothetical protein
MISKEKLTEIVQKSVEDAWYNRRLLNPVKEQTEIITNAIWEQLNKPDVIGWVALSEREPENEDTYYVYPSKYSHTAYYNKYGKWAGKWTRDDKNGYEYEVYITHWKIIEPPCL